mmetsp:Transcript_12776/g.31371  ORF Transcript_12776/g.31371 Transcript_12776/m.31371 type:complete len:748 (+) Transcript_12776:323-2566(+)
MYPRENEKQWEADRRAAYASSEAYRMRRASTSASVPTTPSITESSRGRRRSLRHSTSGEPPSLFMLLLARLFPKTNESGDPTRPMHLVQRAPSPPAGMGSFPAGFSELDAVMEEEAEIERAQSSRGGAYKKHASMYHRKSSSDFQDFAIPENFSNIKEHGKLPTSTSKFLSPHRPEQVHSRTRSASVDVLWLRKRLRSIQRAWWKMEQRDLDAIRRSSHPKVDPGVRHTIPRKRSVVSPLLVQQSKSSQLQQIAKSVRIAGIPGVPGAMMLATSPHVHKNGHRTFSLATEGKRRSNYDGASEQTRRHASKANSTASRDKAAREASAARWRDLKQVDRMYKRKLARAHQRNQQAMRMQQTYEMLRSREIESISRETSTSTVNGPNYPYQVHPHRQSSLANNTRQISHISRASDAMSVGSTRTADSHISSVGMSEQEKRIEFWKDTVIPNWDIIAPSRIVRMLWDRHGVPPSLRKFVWPLALGCGPKQTANLEKFEVYLKRENDLFSRSLDMKHCHTEEPEDVGLTFGAARRKSIRQDLCRMSELDCNEGSELRTRMSEVLMAFCQARPDVTYVQGMSYLVLILLRHMPQDSAFRCLCNLLDCDYFHAYLDMDAEQIRLRFTVFDKLFEANLPRLHKYFKTMGLPPDCYLMEWLMCLHSKQLSVKAASRVWDGYLIHGEIFVLRIAIAILALLQRRLLKSSFNECVKLLRSKFETLKEGALVDAARLVRIPSETTARLVTAPKETPASS